MTRPTRGPGALPDFPWDALAPARALAARHPDGLVDLSIGTPVDRVPVPVRTALGNASDAPGYPTVHGTAALREAYTGWLARAHGVRDLDPESVLPTVGSKELVASLPVQLGFGRGDVVVIPDLAYPTYEVGALMAGCTVLRKDGVASSGADRIALVWINSPSNPTGRVLSAEQLARIVGWARQRGAIVASDECYIDLGWEASPVSVLDPEVCGRNHHGVLAVHSLSKRSSMAGYRAGFVSGDPELVGRLTALRRHLGAMVPAPVQAAAAAALNDDGHVLAQRGRYQRRRELLMDALDTGGFRIGQDGTSAAGLYLWCTRDEPAADSVEWLAERGILVAPGNIYGAAGGRHVRVALTASDERVAAAAARLNA